MKKYVLIAMIFTFSSYAEVRVTKLEPPVRTGISSDELKAVAIDFDQDGKIDVQLVSGLGSFSAYFPSTNRIAVKIAGNSVACLPFGFAIGSQLSSESNTFRWDAGTVVPSEVPELIRYGERRKAIISTLMASPTPTQPILSGTTSTNTTMVRPLGAGDVIGKAGAIAMEFKINGNTHYGYIHVDFKNDDAVSGVIRGYAYETVPNTPMVALPLDLSDR